MDFGDVGWFPLCGPRVHSRLWTYDQVILGSPLFANAGQLRNAHFNPNLDRMAEDSSRASRQQRPMGKEVNAVVFLAAPAGAGQLLGECREGIA
jgi:hypothetical protein